MPKIEEIDQNFKQNTDESGLLYIDCFTAPVRISGLPWKEKNQNYHRMDDSLNHLYNFGVRGLSPCTVDSLHPNDFGFMRMAQVILPVLEEALGHLVTKSFPCVKESVSEAHPLKGPLVQRGLSPNEATATEGL